MAPATAASRSAEALFPDSRNPAIPHIDFVQKLTRYDIGLKVSADRRMLRVGGSKLPAARHPGRCCGKLPFRHYHPYQQAEPLTMSMAQIASAAISDAVFVRHGQAIRLTAIAALVFTTAVAAELPRLLSDLLNLHAPVYSFVVPSFAVFWAPALLIALWFNSMVRGGGRFLFQVEPAFVAAAVLILSLIVLEIAHALARAEPPSFEVVFEFLWLLFVFVVLRSFSYLRGWSEIMLITAAVCAAAISLGSMIFPFRSVMDLGIGEFFTSPLRPLWSGVNSHSYFAAIIVISALYRILFMRNAPCALLFWVAMAAVNLAGIAANKSRGAWIAVLAGVALQGIARITGWSGRTILFAVLVLGISSLGHNGIFYRKIMALRQDKAILRDGWLPLMAEQTAEAKKS